MRKSKKISLGISNILYYGSETFVVVEMENASGINFEIDFLKLYKVNGNNKRKSSYQETELNPIYTYGMPRIFRSGAVIKAVYVIPKFTLAEIERLVLRLHELHGSRSVELKLR